MKIFTTKLLGLALAGMILGACSQTATFEDADLMNEQAVADKAGFKLTPFGMNGENALMYTEDACETSCITDDAATWFVRSYEHVFDPLPPAKKLKVNVYNTPTQLIYDIFTENTTIKYLRIDGALVINDVVSSSYQHVVELGEFGVDWEACDTELAQIIGYRQNLTGGGSGTTGTINTSYDLVGVCQGCDDESFSYEAIVAGTDLVNVVFTYDAAEPLEDAEVKFTFPQILDISEEGVYNAPDEKVYSVNNDGNNTVFTWIGDIGCTDAEATTFEFEVMADCNASGKAQIWTDTKVNGVSVKNDNTLNIRFYCSDQTIEESNEED